MLLFLLDQLPLPLKEGIGSPYIISTWRVNSGTSERFAGQVARIVGRYLKTGLLFACTFPFWMCFEIAPALMSRMDFPSETLEKVVSAYGEYSAVAVGHGMAASLQTASFARERMDRRIRTSWITPFIWSL
jgi:hypothetical protein